MNPISLYVKLTGECNIRCEHCYIKDYKGFMSEEVLDKASEYFGKYKDKIVILHGGEPTLAGKEMIRRAVEKFKPYSYIGIQTNLHYDIKPWIDFFAENFEMIGTSLDKSRNKEILFENIKVLREKGLQVNVNVVITDDYIDSFVNNDLKFLEDYKVSFRLEAYKIVPRMRELNYLNYLKLAHSLKNHPLNFHANPESAINCLPNSEIYNSFVDGGNCARYLRVLEVDGEVYICPNFAGYKHLSIGNVMDDNFDDSVNNKTYGYRMFYEREKRLLMNGSCGACEVYDKCRSGCVSNVYFSKVLTEGKIPLLEEITSISDVNCGAIKVFFQQITESKRIQ